VSNINVDDRSKSADAEGSLNSGSFFHSDFKISEIKRNMYMMMSVGKERTNIMAGEIFIRFYARSVSGHIFFYDLNALCRKVKCWEHEVQGLLNAWGKYVKALYM